MKTKRSVQRRREAQNVVGKLMETLLDKVIRCVEDKMKEVNKVVEFTLRGGGGKEDGQEGAQEEGSKSHGNISVKEEIFNVSSI